MKLYLSEVQLRNFKTKVENKYPNIEMEWYEDTENGEYEEVINFKK